MGHGDGQDHGRLAELVMVALERPQTHLTVSTVPEAVEVYLDRQPNESVMPGIRRTLSCGK